MHTTEQPLFLFLHGLNVQATALPGAKASVVALDMDNRQRTIFATAQGIGERRNQSLHTAALFVGGEGKSPLFHGAGFRHVVDTWQDVFERILGWLGGFGPAGFQLDTHASFFLDNDVFPEDTLHATDPGFWTPDARAARAGIFHTRDAAIWTGNATAGFAPSLCPKAYAGRVEPDDDTLTALMQAAQAAGIPWDPRHHLHDALDRVLVGTVANHGSGHAVLAMRQRLREDLALLPRIWRHTRAAPRPVVPVFL